MNIWIDGDACPKQVRQILFRASSKREVPLLFVANHVANIPNSPFIKRIVVVNGYVKARINGAGFDPLIAAEASKIGLDLRASMRA